jgi:ADP-ribosylglycohydrolase
MISNEDKIQGSLLGFIVGDALGVPVEFNGRAGVGKDAVEDMIGYGR